MKAFLLAAGRGTRLKPYTDTTPKCLIPINGIPLLAIWLNLLERHRVDTVIVNLHHHAEKVSAFIREISPRLDIRIVSVYESTLLGSAGTVWANRDRVAGDEPFFIAYADNLTDCNLTGMADFHRSRQATGNLLTMGLMHAPDPRACGIATMDADSRIVSFTEKPAAPSGDLANAGIYVASPDIFDYFPPRDDTDDVLDFGFHILPRLAGKMAGYVIRDYLRDIGTLDAYHRAQAEWRRHTARKR